MVRKSYVIFLALIVTLFAWQSSFASQEGVLNLSSFSIKSEGIGGSGPVQITGMVSKNDVVTSLRIEAFGKEYILSKEEIAKIPAGSYNGMQLSYEAGYKELGGRTIYIILQKGFISGVTNRVLVTLTESGTIKVEKL